MPLPLWLINRSSVNSFIFESIISTFFQATEIYSIHAITFVLTKTPTMETVDLSYTAYLKTEMWRIEPSLLLMDYGQYAMPLKAWRLLLIAFSKWFKRNWASICEVLHHIGRYIVPWRSGSKESWNHGSFPPALPMTYKSMASDMRKFVKDTQCKQVLFLFHFCSCRLTFW